MAKPVKPQGPRSKPPVTKTFDISRVQTGTKPQILVAIIDLKARGCLLDLGFDIDRDGAKTFDIQTYSVKVTRGGAQINITAWDRTVTDVSDHTYRVYGQVTLRP